MTTNLAHLTSLGNLITAIQTHTQALSMGVQWGNSAEDLRVQIAENLAPLEEAGLPNFVPAPFESLRKFAGGEDVALAELAAAKSQLEYVSQFLRSLNGAGNGSSERFRRLTGPARPSTRPTSMPPSHRADALASVGSNGSIHRLPEMVDLSLGYPTRGENREISVAFVDVVGFTPLGEMLSHDEVFPVLNSVLEELEEAVESEGGEVPANWGDALIALFGSRRGENHARAAIRACLKMERALVEWNRSSRQGDMPILLTRFGIDTGEVAIGYLGGKRRKVRTAIGRHVNIAARLESIAFVEKENGIKEFGIFASARTLRSAGPFFASEPMGLKSLKGVAEPIETHRIHHEAPPSLIPRGAFQTTFIGRQYEFSQLKRDFSDCCENSRSSFVIIKGEAGEGKSRLGDRFIRELGQNATLLLAQGEDREALIHYEAIASALSALAGLEPGEDPERARNKVKYVTQTAAASDQDVAKDLERRLPFLWQLLNIPYKANTSDQAFAELLERPHEFWEQVLQTVEILFDQLSKKQPLVLVVEDLHWVDPGSLGFIKRLLTRFEEQRFFVLGLSRPAFVNQASDFINETEAKVISLEPLSDEQLRKIVGEIIPTSGSLAEEQKVVGQIIHLSGGNPYLITEIATEVLNGMIIEQDQSSKTWQFISTTRGMRKVVPLPSGAMGFLQAKIDLLGETHKEVLRLAAVLGGEFTSEDLTGLANTIINSGEENSLLSLETGTMLAQEPRSILNEMVAEKVIIPMDERGRYQFPHALLRETAYEQIWKKTRAEIHLAMARYLKERRPGELATIASHLASGGHREEASQYYYRVSEKGCQADPEGSIEYYRKGYEQASDPRLKLRLLRGWDEALYTSGKCDEQEKIYQLSLPLLESLPPIDRAGTHYRRARALNKLFRFDEAILELQETLRIISDLSPQSPSETTEMLKLKASALLQIGLTYGEIGRAEDALAVYEEGYKAAAEAGDFLNMGRGLWGLVDGSNKIGRYSGVLERASKAYESLVAIRDQRRLIGLLAEWSRSYLQLGDYNNAESTLRKAQEIAGGLQGAALSVGEVVPLMGKTLTLLGRNIEAIRLLQSFQNPNKSNYLLKLVYLSFAYLNHGQLEAAKAEAEKAITLAVETKNQSMEAAARMVVAKVLLKEGKTSEALTANIPALSIFTDGQVTADLDLEILDTHATILDRLGRLEEAWKHIERAKNILAERSRTIDAERDRVNFLGRIDTNRAIVKLWQVLSVAREIESSKQAEIRAYLDQLDFYHFPSVPNGLQNIIGKALEMPGEIVSSDDHEITHRSKAHEAAEVGAVLVDGPLTSIFAFISNSEIELDVNPGELEEFHAEQINFKLLRDIEKTLWGLADWNIGSPLIRGKIALAVSRRGRKMREILEGEVTSKDGSVVIELRRSPKSSFVTQEGEVIDFSQSKRKRPKEMEFGTLRFTFVPQDIGQTVVVMEMGKALYSRNVQNFLRAFFNAYRSRRT